MQPDSNSEHGYNGQCCCKCKHQIRLRCHPSNGAHPLDKLKFGRGSVAQFCGWACTFQPEDEKDNTAFFMDFEHGMCEGFEAKNLETR